MARSKAGESASGAEKQAESIVRKTRWAPAQRVRCHSQWSEEAEDRFLDSLAANCNVEMACREAGVAHTTVYRQRRKRADFALKWQAALEQGYARLELGLVEAANRALSAEGLPADSPVSPMSAETALRVLQLHRASATGQGKRSGWQAPPRRLEEVQDSILRRIESIQRARHAKLSAGGQESRVEP